MAWIVGFLATAVVALFIYVWMISDRLLELDDDCFTRHSSIKERIKTLESLHEKSWDRSGTAALDCARQLDAHLRDLQDSESFQTANPAYREAVQRGRQVAQDLYNFW